MTRVKWTETYTNLFAIPENRWDDLEDLDRHYEGTVIGTVRHRWKGTLLVVACTDGKVREVSAAKVDAAPR